MRNKGGTTLAFFVVWVRLIDNQFVFSLK